MLQLHKVLPQNAKSPQKRTRLGGASSLGLREKVGLLQGWNSGSDRALSKRGPDHDGREINTDMFPMFIFIRKSSH